MTIRMEDVNLADVYPLEDEFGNQFTSRDYSIRENQAYVERLAESMRAKGIPDEPIVLVPDGGIYRIKTGNSRVRAMKMLGTARCPAVIDDTADVKAVVEAVVRTDVKKTYEAVERSRYVQQLAMFGDDEYVAETAGITVDEAKRVRRVRKKVDDAAEDMTLERILLIDEFLDDGEAVRELADCTEAEARDVAARLRRQREAERRIEAFRAAFALAGVPVVESREELAGKAYFVSVPTPSEVASYLPAGRDPDQCAAFLSGGYSVVGVRAELYAEPDPRESGEEAELRRQADAYAEAIGAMDEARDGWFWRRVMDGYPLPRLWKDVVHHYETQWWVKEARRAMPDEAYRKWKSQPLTLMEWAMGYPAVHSSGTVFARCLARGEVEDYRRGKLAAYVDELRAYMAEGWDPGDATALVGQLAALADADGEVE